VPPPNAIQELTSARAVLATNAEAAVVKAVATMKATDRVRTGAKR
jgi:hypothetical protein